MPNARDSGLVLELDPTDAESRVTTGELLRALYELGKPNLSAMVSLSGVLGYRLAVHEFQISAGLWLALGLWLTSYGACGLNMVVEHSLDARMRRTRDRPIPSGRLGATRASVASVVGFALGFGILWVTFPPLTALLSVLTAFVYLVVYTPLKRFGPVATWVGAIPGAIPPVMGWAAATGDLGVPAVALFTVLFFWQIPHFFALAWMYRDDYRRGGFDFVPEGRDRSIVAQMIGSAGLLLLASLSLVAIEAAGWVYGACALVLGSAYFLSTLRLKGSPEPSHARSVFLWSIAYLPTLFAALILDRALL